MHKKSLSLLLLMVIIFNMTGIFIVFKIEQVSVRKSIKQQIKNGVPEDKLHYFSFTKKEFLQLNWIRPDKEFRLKKEMFDIVRSEFNGDSIRLQCVNDKQETLLFARLDELIQKKMDQNTEHSDSPIRKGLKFLKQIYMPGDFYHYIHSNSLFLTIHFTQNKIIYTSPFLEFSPPPPDFV